MIVHPSTHQRVRLHYAARWIAFGAPFHNRTGTVTTSSRGPGPRNHAVTLDDGTRVVVPCGNLQPHQTTLTPKDTNTMHTSFDVYVFQPSCSSIPRRCRLIRQDDLGITSEIEFLDDSTRAVVSSNTISREAFVGISLK